ncbi:hypothetical protein NN561_006770 [Cricetulus griseus]
MLPPAREIWCVMDFPLMGRRRMVAMPEPLDAHASCGSVEILISATRSLTSVFSPSPTLENRQDANPYAQGSYWGLDIDEGAKGFISTGSGVQS